MIRAIAGVWMLRSCGGGKAEAADGWPSADPRGRPPKTADTPARVPRDRHTRTPIGPPNTLYTASSRAFAAYSFSAESASAPAR